VSEHPEARNKIFKPHSDRPKRDRDGTDNGEVDTDRYDEQGRLRDPTRSIYFDPVYNPWGAPPPGMPYKERSQSTQPRYSCS
jgi:hypothetical protein